MRDCLKGRSLVERIFVSFSSKANEPMNKRDKPKTAVLDELEVDGDTNDLISFISTNKKVCLVAIDHAGLTTNCEDLRDFLEKNENLAMIIIDNLPFNNKVHIYERGELLLNNSKLLQNFNCRNRPQQRSKK
ncbi:uncharacterized protein BX663DRAFT_435776 [Cokeromyces recurvatus]|uniref:uncharacterized protein n=1 Tax=Cokeromyces recurvatus TaxID=90255 RepID=UPI00221E940D|nr:uncharacterized protein BX663DRAFT_435776 [Cokeromyces recurvatus]KAI7902288.1 hypothetical protein BX663DRAFT_435776 [Cokeromyces recurvatus]